jgi:ariadne-1
VRCDCGFWFCFICGMEAHAPATCVQFSRWKETEFSMTNDASVSAMRNEYKMCPKCKAFIDKTTGCRHMTCASCKYEFCWNCKAKWTNYQVCAV